VIKKFARRFVMPGRVNIRLPRRYLPAEAMRQRGTGPCNIIARKGRLAMRKTILTILTTALVAGAAVQSAAAAQHHKAHKVVRAPAAVSEPIRNANAYYGWRNPSPQPYVFDEALSPPAGH
jgi:hypothetical protein